MQISDVLRNWRREAVLGEMDGTSLMYRDVYVLRCCQRFEFLDQVLAAIDVSEFPPVFLVGLLTVTAACARELSEREMFFYRVRGHLVARLGERKANLMLGGLDCCEGWASKLASEEDGHER